MAQLDGWYCDFRSQSTGVLSILKTNEPILSPVTSLPHVSFFRHEQVTLTQEFRTIQYPFVVS